MRKVLRSDTPRQVPKMQGMQTIARSFEVNLLRNQLPAPNRLIVESVMLPNPLPISLLQQRVTVSIGSEVQS